MFKYGENDSFLYVFPAWRVFTLDSNHVACATPSASHQFHRTLRKLPRPGPGGEPDLILSIGSENSINYIPLLKGQFLIGQSPKRLEMMGEL